MKDLEGVAKERTDASDAADLNSKPIRSKLEILVAFLSRFRFLSSVGCAPQFVRSAVARAMLRLHALGRARPRSVFALARFHPTNCSSMQCKNHVSRSGFFSTSGAAPSQLPPPLADDTIFSNGHQELADASDPLESNRGTVLDVDGSFAFVEDMPFLPLGAVVVFERSGVHGTERQNACTASLVVKFINPSFNICYPSPRAGLVMKISKEFIMIGVLGPTAAIVSGDIVSLLGSTLTFPTGPTLEGTPLLTIVVIFARTAGFLIKCQTYPLCADFCGLYSCVSCIRTGHLPAGRFP